MKTTPINIPELFKAAWKLLKEYPAFYFSVSFLYISVFIVPELYTLIKQTQAQLLLEEVELSTKQTIISFVLRTIQLILGCGVVNVFLKVVKGEHVDAPDLFVRDARIMHYILSSFLYYIVVLLGMTLIIPGVYLAIRLQFYSFFILDEGEDWIGALIKSWKFTDNMMMELFIYHIVVFFIVLAGFLFAGIGLIPALVILFITQALIYISRKENGPIPLLKYREDAT